MSYTDRETSEYAGAPVEIFVFTKGTQIWRVTSSDRSITVDGQLYTPIKLARRGLSFGNESAGAEVELEIPMAHDIAEAIRANSVYQGGITMVARKVHRDDAEAWALFSGIIGRVRKADFTRGTLSFVVYRLDSILGRFMPRLAVSGKCQYMLYKELCKKNPVEVQFSSTLTVALGNPKQVTVAGLSAEEAARNDNAARFVGGIVLAGGAVVAYIEGRGSGDDLFLRDGDHGLTNGAAIVLYPGCDRELFTCLNRHNNVINYGGWHVKPPVNDPFDGRFGLLGSVDEFGNPITEDGPSRPRGRRT